MSSSKEGKSRDTHIYKGEAPSHDIISSLDLDDKSGYYQNSILAMSNSNILSNSVHNSTFLRLKNKDGSANVANRVSKQYEKIK